MSAKPSVLPMDMVLEGDMEGDGDLVVYGKVAGSIRVDGALVIEASGEVRGDVHGATVTVRGTLVGDASATTSLWVEKDARVMGDLAGPRVKVVEGAAFRGRLHVGELATRAPGSLALRAGDALAASARPAAEADPRGRERAPRQDSPRPPGIPRMPRPGRASGRRRAAL